MRFLLAFFFIVPLIAVQNLETFLETVESQPLAERGGLFEMGLVSDHPGIFYHSLQKVVQDGRLKVLPILEKLLRRKALSGRKRNLLEKAQLQLKYKQLKPANRHAFLQRILKRPASKTTHNILVWALNQFADVALKQDEEILNSLKGRPSLVGPLKLTRKKISYRLQYPHPTQRFISASKSPNLGVRDWAFKALVQIDSSEVAHYLSRLNEQRHLLSGRLESRRIEHLYQTHQDRFPEHY